tara:strand:+ start:1807 stop:2199 length:393 start_codon:yes stop_codon:yes gene_type:complete
MTEINSKTVIASKSAKDLYNQLINFQNFGPMMPDSVQKFEADESSFLFQMKGIPEVRLVLDKSEEPGLIQFKSASSKLDFTLACLIEAIDENSCRGRFEFRANFNMMLKMMVERPLTNFIENLADKLKEI